MQVFKTYDKFILDNPTRVIGPELDFGWWRTLTHPRATRLSWNKATGDLYMFNVVTNVVVVLIRIEDEDEVRRVLNGWEYACSTEQSGQWLMHRMKSASKAAYYKKAT